MEKVKGNKKVILAAVLGAILLCVAAVFATNALQAGANPSPHDISKTDNGITVDVAYDRQQSAGISPDAIFNLAGGSRAAKGVVVGPKQTLAASFHAWVTPDQRADQISKFRVTNLDVSAYQQQWQIPDGTMAYCYFEWYDGSTKVAPGTFKNGTIEFDTKAYPWINGDMWSYMSVVVGEYEKPVPPGPTPTPTPDVGPTSPQTGVWATH